MTKLKPVPKSRSEPKSRPQLPKTPTGIPGLDEITGGGLPKGRTTLVCGGAGSGKTLLAMEFLVHGATQFNEPGVFMAFEETAEDLAQNVVSLGFDLKDLIARKKMVLDFVYLERSEIEESGAFDLEGLFIRLGQAIDSIGAKRVVLDTIEALFAGLPNPRILRAELRRLYRWLKEKGVTAIITSERGDGTLTRQGLEEYVFDCVIALDHRVQDQVVSRRLRVVKYRGSTHGTNDFPFLIDEDGILVLPISSLGIPYIVSTDRIPSGIARLDTMLGGGYYRGSSVQVSGTAGTGKTSLAAHFAEAACRRGERVLYFPLKESSNQIMRNMRSIGIDMEPWVRKGLLQFEESRPTLVGLEIHLAMMHKSINSFQPQVVILDPMTSFVIGGNETEVKAMLIRLVDSLKMKQITLLVTSFAASGGSLEEIDAAMSPLMDTSLLLRDIELGGERNRAISIVKSRGMAHSNQIREFLLTDHGVELHDVYVGPGGVLTGAARLTQEVQEQAAQLAHQQQVERRKLELENMGKALEAQIAAMRAEFAAKTTDVFKLIEQEQAQNVQLGDDRTRMGLLRSMDTKEGKPKGGAK